MISTIFSRPKSVKIKAPQPTPTGTAPTQFQAINSKSSLQVVVFNDKDRNNLRGFGEEGLDWQVYYKLADQQDSQVLETRSASKCFPTIFNWTGGGCSQEVPVKFDQWLTVWAKTKPGWRLAKGNQMFVTKEGKNLVYLAVQRLKPNEVNVESSPVLCQQMEIGYEGKVENDNIVLITVLPQPAMENLKYKLVVDDQSYDWQANNKWQVKLARDKDHTLRGYIKTPEGEVVGGSGRCQKNISANLSTQPETGTTWTWLVVWFMALPVLGFSFIKLGLKKGAN